MILIKQKIIINCLLLFLILFLISCASNNNSRVYYNYDHGYHTVLKGETLYAIAFRHGIDYKKNLLAGINIHSPYTIYAGNNVLNYLLQE